MHVSDVMTRFVTTVSPETPLLDAARLMLSARISGLPVVDAKGVVLGLISEADLVRSFDLNEPKPFGGLLSFLLGSTSATEFIRASNKPTREVMCHPPILVSDDATLQDAFALMQRQHIKRIPVVRDGKLVGILSRRDLLRVAVDLAEVASA